MPSKRNVALYEEITQLLNQNPNVLITTYTGLTVEELNQLRKKVREKKGKLKVVKNNIFKLAIKNSKQHEYEERLKDIESTIYGPIAVTFAGDEIPSIAKIFVEISKENEKVQLLGGYYEGKFLDKNQIKAIAGLPTKDELLAMIARGLNTPAQKIAIGINEVIAKLARGIKAVSEKKNQQ